MGCFLEATKSPTRGYEEDARSDSAARVGGPDPGMPNCHVRPTSGRVRVLGCPLWQRDWQRGGGVGLSPAESPRDTDASAISQWQFRGLRGTHAACIWGPTNECHLRCLHTAGLQVARVSDARGVMMGAARVGWLPPRTLRHHLNQLSGGCHRPRIAGEETEAGAGYVCGRRPPPRQTAELGPGPGVRFYKPTLPETPGRSLSDAATRPFCGQEHSRNCRKSQPRSLWVHVPEMGTAPGDGSPQDAGQQERPPPTGGLGPK